MAVGASYAWHGVVVAAVHKYAGDAGVWCMRMGRRKFRIYSTDVELGPIAISAAAVQSRARRNK